MAIPDPGNNTYPITALTQSGYFCDFTKVLNNTYEFGLLTSGKINPTQFCSCCPAGFYCPSTEMYPPESDAKGIRGETLLLCPKGSYCPSGTDQPLECYSAQVCEEEGLSTPQGGTFVNTLFWCILLFLILPYLLELGRSYLRNRLRAKRVVEKQALKDAAAEKGVELMSNVKSNNGPPEKRRSVRKSVRKSLQLNSDGTIPTKEKEKKPRIIESLAFSDGQTFTIDFRNICVFKEVEKEKQFFLHNATGCIRGGKVTAVMGPSGCGKSTIVSALCDRITSGGSSGDIFINGSTASAGEVAEMCGFVPQLDIMRESLSVKEVLQWQVELRHDPTTEFADWRVREKLVNEVIESLELHRIRHSFIGGASVRGISGGQRKRVNVAMELMSKPRILFLDEPTSGLDATMSARLLDYMQCLAAGGVTVVMVIHQPNPETFSKIDDVILMKPTPTGGKICYCGPVQDGVEYMKKNGFPVSAHENPADRFIDIVSKEDGNAEGTMQELWDRESNVLFDQRWNDWGMGGVSLPEIQTIGIDIENPLATGVISPTTPNTVKNSTKKKNSVHRSRTKSTDSTGTGPVAKAEAESVAVVGLQRQSPPVWKQTINVAMRVINMQLNGIVTIAVSDFMICLMTLIVCGLGLEILQLFFVMNLIVGMTAGLYGVSIFRDDAVFSREFSAGVSQTALYMGSIFGSVPRLLFMNGCFCVPFFICGYTGLTAGYLFLMVWVGQVCMMCCGIMMTVTIAGPNAEVNTVLFTLLMWMFSGLSPPAAELQVTALGASGLAISFARWMFGSEMTAYAITGSECQSTTQGYVMQTLGLIDGPMGSRPLTLQASPSNYVTVQIPYYAQGQHDYDLSIEHQTILASCIMVVSALAISQARLLKTLRKELGTRYETSKKSLSSLNEKIAAMITCSVYVSRDELNDDEEEDGGYFHESDDDDDDDEEEEDDRVVSLKGKSPI